MDETKTLDYARLWKTLMRSGIKQRFSQIRQEFFMRIAEDGPRVYGGQEDIEDIISNSFMFQTCGTELLEDFYRNFTPEDKFKHYSYHTSDEELYIEYFAALTNGITQPSKDYISERRNDPPHDYDIDGFCISRCHVLDKDSAPIPPVPVDADEELFEELSEEELTDTPELPADPTAFGTTMVTFHFIVIAETAKSITPETYPGIIKHELTHACIFEVRRNFKSGYYNAMKLPSTWTDEDIENWKRDMEYLEAVLEDSSETGRIFKEFVADFLMYESDGQTKEKNPIKESRTPKSTNPNAKSKVTYRTLSPIDRFEENMGTLEKELRELYAPILDALRKDYENYDGFLDEIRM